VAKYALPIGLVLWGHFKVYCRQLKQLKEADSL